MAAIVYLLPQLPTNYHYSMLIHEIKLYYQSALTACLGAPEGQREAITDIFILFVISMFWAYQIPSCLINICNFYVFFCLSKIVCMCFHLGKCLAKKIKRPGNKLTFRLGDSFAISIISYTMLLMSAVLCHIWFCDLLKITQTILSIKKRTFLSVKDTIRDGGSTAL